MSQDHIIANSQLVSGVFHSSNPGISNYLQESGLGLGFKSNTVGVQLGAGMKVGPDSAQKIDLNNLQLPGVTAVAPSTSRFK